MKRLTEKEPAWWVILIPFGILIATLVCVIRFFGADALDGASQVALLLGAGVASALAMTVYGVKWPAIEASIAENIKSIGVSVLILILIGAISGSWMISGVVPTLMYYGLKVLTPKIFLFAVCIICALVSLVTGSSWTTIATIGVAFVGIGMALGYSAGWTAGAIISGAYFGDKISPLSDTTVLASSVTGTPLFEHIRYMMITTVPSMTITCLLFLIASVFHHESADLSVAQFSTALSDTFTISPWLLLVPVLTGFLIAKKLPALLTLFLAALMAGAAALVAQPDIIASIGGGDGGFQTGFKGLMITYYGDTSVQTGTPQLDDLVQTRGITGMLATILLIFCAATFGGTLTGSGMMNSLTRRLTQRISGRTPLVGATVASGIFANMVTGDQYLSIILTSSLYKKLYEDKGYEGRLLSRSTEDSATVTSVLIPWDSCGMTQATVLKVPTLDYLPYCFFNLISPLMSILVAATGYKIYRRASSTSPERIAGEDRSDPLQLAHPEDRRGQGSAHQHP